MQSMDGRTGRARRRADTRSARTLVQIALPKGTPREAEVAVRRLIELVGTLAQRTAQLQEALESRIVIEQAKGVLVGRLDISPDEAFTLLRRAARSNRIRLRDIAEAVVSSRQAPPGLVRDAQEPPISSARS
jgi:hypothetical protein